METSARILTVGGVSVLAYGFLLGLPISMVRMQAPHAPRFLVNAHLAAIIQGAVLLALTRAVSFSTLSTGLETISAWLLVAGAGLFDLGMTINWLQRAGDHFAERTLGWRFLASSAPLNLSGAGILLFGVVKGL